MAEKMITDPKQADRRHFKYLDILGMAWVSCLIISTVTAAKTFDLGAFSFSVSLLIYPITYIFSDVFTEVYGYKQTRRIVWTGFFILILCAVALNGMVRVPAGKDYAYDEAFRTIFYNVPIITVAAISCFFAGEFTNSYVLAKMKIWTKGKYLWTRTVGSTAAGQLVDNFIFCFIAFNYTGVMNTEQTIMVWLSQASFCVIYEFLATPITYKIVNTLKRKEGLDIFDKGTNFNPFAI